MSDLKIPSELYQSMLDELKVAYQEHGDLLRDDMIEAVFKAIEENGYSIVPVDGTDSFLNQITSLESENEKLKNILRKAFPEKSGHFFICGEAGEKDSMGLPEKIMVCPAYGLDGFASYKKDRDYNAPGW